MYSLVIGSVLTIHVFNTVPDTHTHTSLPANDHSLVVTLRVVSVAMIVGVWSDKTTQYLVVPLAVSAVWRPQAVTPLADDEWCAVTTPTGPVGNRGKSSMLCLYVCQTTLTAVGGA